MTFIGGTLPERRDGATRHPAGGRWRPDLARMRARMVERLDQECVPCPEVGAAALAVRGLAGVDQRSFAAQLRLDRPALAIVEQGRCPPSAVPVPLRQRAAWIDWDSLGADASGSVHEDDRATPARVAGGRAPGHRVHTPEVDAGLVPRVHRPPMA